MLTTDGVAIAVEAKAKEPPYPTVREWLGEPPPKNRLQVLQGWLELIGRVVGAPVQGADVEDCSYQLIHRTASACASAAAPRLVVYHCFDAEPSMLDYYRAQLGRLRAGIGDTPGLDLCVVHTAIEPTAEYTRLMDSWHSGHRELASQVRQALLDGAIRVGGSDMIARV